jgi:uncharacterized membrane protein YjgN (DUF898 family)
MARNSGRFHFDGGAATYVGTALLGVLITVCTLGICYPFALVLKERWRAKHSYIDGQRLTFTGTGIGLFGTRIKWFLLIIITIGIYSFWVGPRIVRWKWEHTDFDPTWRPNTLPQPEPAAPLGSPQPSVITGPMPEVAPAAHDQTPTDRP